MRYSQVLLSPCFWTLLSVNPPAARQPSGTRGLLDELPADQQGRAILPPTQGPASERRRPAGGNRHHCLQPCPAIYAFLWQLCCAWMECDRSSNATHSACDIRLYHQQNTRYYKCGNERLTRFDDVGAREQSRCTSAVPPAHTRRMHRIVELLINRLLAGLWSHKFGCARNSETSPAIKNLPNWLIRPIR